MTSTSDNGSGSPFGEPRHQLPWLILGVIMMLWIVATYLGQVAQVTQMPYSEFKAMIRQAAFQEVIYGPAPYRACPRRGKASHPICMRRSSRMTQTCFGSWRPTRSAIGWRRRIPTEQKRLAQEMARSERLALAGQLASGLAQEIGTPLNVIAGTAEFLLGDLAAEDLRQADLEVISQESHRVADLVRRLLGLLRERGGQPAAAAFRDLIDHTLRLLAYRFQQVHIEVVKHYAPNMAPVFGVRAELEQVLLNLLVNAWHAMPAGGTITIATECREAQAVITITDTGAAFLRNI